MKKLLLALAAILTIATLGSTTACERLVTQVVYDTTHDTTYVNKVTTKTDTVTLTRVDTLVRDHYDTTVVTKTDTVVTIRVDTTFVPRVDTVFITKTDTVIKVTVDTVIKPVHDTTFVPVHDTTIVIKVDTITKVVHDTVTQTLYDTTFVTKYDTVTQWKHDTTFVPRTDTLYLPSQVVHDTAWLYTRTNPTNPLAGGDPTSGLMVLQVYDTYYLVFWHAHFVGVLYSGGSYWRAYLTASEGSMIMPMACDKPTWQEAAGCLEPMILVLYPVGTPAPIRVPKTDFNPLLPR